MGPRWRSSSRRLLQGAHTWVELLVRLVLLALFLLLDWADPLIHRKIHPEEMWLYKNPVTPSYFSTQVTWVIVVAVPVIVISTVFAYRQDQVDTVQAVQGSSLSILVTGVITNTIKLIAARPRPDFFYRCFPDGQFKEEMACTGDIHIINEGLKSFPSGHSSLSFASLGFISWYLTGKLHIFTNIGRGQAWRLCIALTPFLFAMIIALSRTADYHHHWQDVLVGSLLGIGISFMCYRQYYPKFSDPMAHQPYVALTPLAPHVELNQVTTVSPASTNDAKANQECIKLV